MSWQREGFRFAYRQTGSIAASNSYVSYLNRVDAISGGLDELIDRIGGDAALDRIDSMPVATFGDTKRKGDSMSAPRWYLRFIAPGAPAAARDIVMPIVEQQDAVTLAALLGEARSLGARYYRLTGKPLGVTGEVAELAAAEALGIELCIARTPGYDAIDHSGEQPCRVQIKGRAVDATDRYRGMCPSIRYGDRFDYVLLVLLDRLTMDTLEIWRSDEAAVAARLSAPAGRARNERNTLAISQFRSIAQKVWP